jgi:hypothetical protein
MAGDTFLDPKTDLWPNKVSLCRWLSEPRDMGQASAARNPASGSLQLKGCPSPTRNRLAETTAGAFSQPEGANRWRRAKVDETFGTAMAEKSLDFVDLQSFENGQPCIGHLGLRFFLRPNGSVPHALCLLRGWAVGNGELVGHAPAGLIDQQHGAGAG